VKSFLPSNQSGLIHGNELHGGLITGYDKEKEWGIILNQTDWLKSSFIQGAMEFNPIYHIRGKNWGVRFSYSAYSGNISRNQHSSRRALAAKNGIRAAATTNAGQLCQTKAQPTATAMTLV
jgi:hypothetical protein